MTSDINSTATETVIDLPALFAAANAKRAKYGNPVPRDGAVDEIDRMAREAARDAYSLVLGLLLSEQRPTSGICGVQHVFGKIRLTAEVLF